MTEQQQLELIHKCGKAAEMIRSLTANLSTASQKLTEQADLIEHLSKDNLALVAKLDQLTGKTAPGTTFAA